MQSKNLKNYFSFFNFNRFPSIFNRLYGSSDEFTLKERLEFSSLFSSEKEMSLKFGLFKIFDERKIVQLANEENMTQIRDSLELMKDFTPEYAIGFDRSRDQYRFKLYFLRLPDNKAFDEELLLVVHRLAENAEIESPHLDELKKSNCYLLGRDYYIDGKTNLKVYTHTNLVNYTSSLLEIEQQGFDVSDVASLCEYFDECDFQDTTYSYKYTNNSADLSGFAVFFEPRFQMNRKIEGFINKKYPYHAKTFESLISFLEENSDLVYYNQIGFSFSIKRKSGDLCVYYSPTMEDQ